MILLITGIICALIYILTALELFKKEITIELLAAILGAKIILELFEKIANMATNSMTAQQSHILIGCCYVLVIADILIVYIKNLAITEHKSPHSELLTKLQKHS